MIAPSALPFAFGAPAGRARIRVEPADFEVEEVLAGAPEGAGGHAWLRVEKTGANTDWVAGRLAELAGARVGDVGYAGLKDRHAVTVQWFSVDLRGGPMPAWGDLEADGLRVLEVTRGARKLRRGGLVANRFRIRLRGIALDEALAGRVAAAGTRGVPNYFGPQRFGRDGGNLAAALAMFRGERRPRGRHLRGLYLSAARSHLFNAVLAERVHAGTWETVLPGEALISPRAARAFPHHRAREAREGRLEAAVAAHDLHPTGPLWGRGPPLARGHALAVEAGALAGLGEYRAGLEAAGLAHERRALRLTAEELAATPCGDGVVVAFTLRRGSFATAVLRELAATEP